MLLHQFYVSALEMRGAYETLTTKKKTLKNILPISNTHSSALKCSTPRSSSHINI
jgi:hypothetical protein